MKSSNSTFLYNGFSDNGKGTGGPWAAIATIVATAGPLVFGGGGNSAADNRKRKRESLAALGFRWDWTKGYQSGDYDNIDGWDDTSLDNIAEAYNQYGQIVVDLHNQGKFNQGNTKSMSQIQQIVQQNGGSTGGGGIPGISTGSVPGIDAAGGQNYMPLLITGGVVVLVIAMVSRQQPGKK